LHFNIILYCKVSVNVLQKQQFHNISYQIMAFDEAKEQQAGVSINSFIRTAVEKQIAAML
ncbi:MAG: hypothetical protein K2J23_03250, partial [Muribaculaceae bacterium]|nr:hypothetical protein [Muribaculaceae bacterium]